MNRDLLQMLGLSLRAGAILLGDDKCISAVRSRKAQVVLLAVNAGSNTKKKYHDKCSFYRVPVVELLSKEELGHALGKSDRSVVVVTNPGIAKRILQLSGEKIGGETNE